MIRDKDCGMDNEVSPEQLITYVPPEIAAKIREAAEKDGRSISNWIGRVLARELEQSAV